MTEEPIFSRTMRLGDPGGRVKLDVLPRKDFGGDLGHQVGVRLTTYAPDGQSLWEQTIGLSDEDRFALAVALYKEGPLG